MDGLPLSTQSHAAAPAAVRSRFARVAGSSIGGYRATSMRFRDDDDAFEIWNAVDAVGRPVFLQMLTPLALADGDAEAGLRAAIATMERVTHPSLQALEASVHCEGWTVAALTPPEGLPLDAVLADVGSLTVTEALHVGIQIGGALAALHAEGLVHLRVSPGAVTFSHVRGFAPRATLGCLDAVEGRLLDDLGIPRRAIPRHPWAAPEQRVGEVNVRADVYSVGALMLGAMIGQPDGGVEGIAASLEGFRTGRERPLRRRLTLRQQVTIGSDTIDALEGLIRRAVVTGHVG